MKHKAFLFISGLLLLVFESALVSAADVRSYISGSGSYRSVIIEGVIEPGDHERFLRVIQENQGNISGLYIFSPGGDFYEAMKIGRSMRALELSSQVPMRDSLNRPVCESGLPGQAPQVPSNCICASACFFIHIGAVHRGGNYLAVHRPYFARGIFGELTQSEAQAAFDDLQQSARQYMFEMGVPQHIQEEILGTPSERTLILDDSVVKTYFWGALPYRHEWKRNRCIFLTEQESLRLEEYSERLIRAARSPKIRILDSERSDFAALQEKQRQEMRCDIEIENNSRIEAYSRYFGISPSDYASQDFSKWSDSIKYLGMSFSEILLEGGFVEDNGFSPVLKREATHNSPLILLMGSATNERNVVSISMVSTPSPSVQYINGLVQTLDVTWGVSSVGDGETEWLWQNQDFNAKLMLEPASASGPFLSLTIRSRTR